MLMQITKLFQKNLAIFLFFSFIVFLFASIWHNNTQTTQNANELVNFAKSSIDEVDTALDKLVVKSSKYQVLISNNENQLSDLYLLSKRLQILSNSIPNKNTDDSSVNLENSLRKLFISLKKDILDPLIVKTESTKGKYPDFLLIEESTLKTKAFDENISGLQNHLNAVAARFSLG
jgi:hypothetical protein